jgi:hypothetical protein
MTAYSAVLFIHVASAIGVFISIAAEGAILFRLRSARSLAEAQLPLAHFNAFAQLRFLHFSEFWSAVFTWDRATGPGRTGYRPPWQQPL